MAGMDGPITVADAKLHLRVETADDDVAIADLIRIAARQIETIYGVVAVRREVAFNLDCFPRDLRIPLVPVIADSITISYLDAAGEFQAFENFRSFVRQDWTFVTPAIGARWPTAAAVPGAITVTATVGHIDRDASIQAQQEAVPHDVRQATRYLVEHLYTRAGGPIPRSVDDLIDHYRYRRL
ncbi:putative phiE125 gp8 family phage protein [Sphingobium sp. JAI105]|uniref:head-tail connector protein n=1 Tax=Sphingobium sp. JAI105 TaxID=2787715 RepID=UPI0018CB4365|nr:hypothetical protein [Sphingobium sp. JAI105]MBG6116787.1 putative phiE125 gp8 family phage protein [Sphingobium sp. JAI105]